MPIETEQQLPEDVEQVLLGSLFGDGALWKQKPQNKKSSQKEIGIKFIERHSLKQKDYLLWKKEVLSKSLMFGKDYECNQKSYAINSIVLSVFKKYYPYFYPYGHGSANERVYKVFTFEMLNKLKPLGLAVWYMDDGHFNKRVNSAKISFHKQNIFVVKKYFRDIYNVGGNIMVENNGARIVFNSKDTQKLFRIIHSYIHPSMKYKIKITREEKLKIIKQNKLSNKLKYEKNKEYYKNCSKNYYYTNKNKPQFKLKLYKYGKKYQKRVEVKKRRKQIYEKNKNVINTKRRQRYRLKNPIIKNDKYI